MSQQLFQVSLLDRDSEGDARKAALLMHAMHPEDREWLLSQLPDSRRRELQALQMELSELGIPADSSLLREFATSLSTKRSPDHSRPEMTAGQVAHQLRKADPAHLASILKGEPAGLVARVLAMEAWPWTEEVLNLLQEASRAGVHRSLSRIQGRSPRPVEADRVLARILMHRLRTHTGWRASRFDLAASTANPGETAAWIRSLVRRWARKLGYSRSEATRRGLMP